MNYSFGISRQNITINKSQSLSIMRYGFKALIILILLCSTACFNSKVSNGQHAFAGNSETQKSNPQGIEAGNPIPFILSLRLPDELSFCGEKVPLDIPEVRERAEREFYVNIQSPGQLILNMKRTARYFPLFDKIFKEEGVPSDLKYLSLAESALYMAKSPKDAVGLWQFLEPTAKRFGLMVTEEVDERKHVEKSTRAAIKYLKNGFQRFNSWSLAAAGYNQGTDGIADDVSFQQKNNYYDLYLNDETSRYLLRIVILKEFIEHGAKYGLVIPQSEYYQETQYSIVRESSAIPNLSAWAIANGTTYKDVKMLNPWIRKRSLPAPKNGAWEIAVPK